MFSMAYQKEWIEVGRNEYKESGYFRRIRKVTALLSVFDFTTATFFDSASAASDAGYEILHSVHRVSNPAHSPFLR